MTDTVACSSLALAQSQPLEHIPVLSMSKTKNGSFSGLDLLNRPLWFLLPLEATLVSMPPPSQAVLKLEVHVDVRAPERHHPHHPGA